MTFKEFGYIADAIKTYFPRDNVLPTEHAMSLWYDGLKDLPYQVVNIALKKYVQTNRFAPSIADIREQAAQLNQNNQNGDLNETEAWSLVLKAIRRSTYYSEEEFAKLPTTVQRAVASPKQLREWATLEDVDGKTLTVIQSNFQRTFRVEQQRERERNKLSPDVLKLMRPLSNPQIEEKPNELSIEDQRLKEEEQAAPAPEDFKSRVSSMLDKEKG